MDYVALKAEITGDPLSRGYAGMTDAQAAASLNTVDRTVKQPVPLRELIVYLLKNGKWGGIKDEAATGALSVKAECKAFMVIMNNPNFSDLDLTDPVVRGMLLVIKDAGLLNAADQTAILAMADKGVSRAVEQGIVGEGEAVKQAHVAHARTL